ncbi:MAG: tRNA epoxyqueuosine(34) reductase QueG [Brevinematia bacterium]
MKDLIKNLILEEGFDLVSVVSPLSLLLKSDLKSKYLTWLSSSLNAEMEYLRKSLEKKFNPLLTEEWVKSVILVGASYFNPSRFDLPSEEYGKVAMYAWGEDYHFVIKTLLFKVVERLKKETSKEFRYRVFSGAAPLYEKGFAVVGNLGFQGKNTCIVHPRLGSFFFIGEILTDIELEPDEGQLEEGCGSCSKCVTSCPTKALRDYVLNASVCISYFTVEYRGMIPEDIACKMGSWTFGCDVCQEVCPFNRSLNSKATKPRIKEFSLNVTPFLNLREVMRISSSNQFRKLFKRKAFLRAGRRGLIRNSIITAVNNGAKSLKEEIYLLSKDTDEVISATAKWALDNL